MDRFGSMSHFLVFSLLYLDWFRIILHNISIKHIFSNMILYSDYGRFLHGF